MRDMGAQGDRIEARPRRIYGWGFAELIFLRTVRPADTAEMRGEHGGNGRVGWPEVKPCRIRGGAYRHLERRGVSRRAGAIGG